MQEYLDFLSFGGKTPDGTQEVPKDYKEISFVCVRKDGMYLGRMHFPTCVAR